MADLDFSLLKEFVKAPTVSAQRRHILKSDSRIFTMGSCFAQEIRNAFNAAGVAVYPNYLGVKRDKKTQMFDLRGQAMPPHYDTFAMHQEFEALAGLWPDRSAGYYAVTKTVVNKMLESPTVYQDPYRKLTYATTLAGLNELAANTTQVIADGLDQSDVVVLTLGLTEVWQHIITGKYFCRPPGSGYGGGNKMAQFRRSTFLENYDNVCAILNIIFARDPNKNVVISVSPVRLQRTYSGEDIATANWESKSILRAVAGQVCREFGERVSYFPAYELAMLSVGGSIGLGGVFKEDAYHVRHDFADMVIDRFKQIYAS